MDLALSESCTWHSLLPWCVNVETNALIKIQTRTARDPTGPATTFRGRAGDDADNHNIETRVARARTAHNRSLLKARGLRGSVQMTRLRSSLTDVPSRRINWRVPRPRTHSMGAVDRRQWRTESSAHRTDDAGRGRGRRRPCLPLSRLPLSRRRSEPRALREVLRKALSRAAPA